MKHIVASVTEIPPGSRKIVAIGPRSIGVFNVDGEFFAIRNNCPHMGAELCRGKIWGRVEADTPGNVTHVPTQSIISCPRHGWEFDIRTGQSWCEPGRLKTTEYSVALETGDEVLSALAHSGQERVRGPYTAELVDVRVEGTYIVLDLP